MGVAIDRGRMLVVGGGARSATFPQLLADLGRRDTPVVEPRGVVDAAAVRAAYVERRRHIHPGTGEAP